jgi:calcineurin-like phosphoesterase family protein
MVGTTWFTADPHFGHARIIELCDRPFASVEEMNEALVHNWNEVVSDGDTVFILGDLALGKIDESLLYVAELKGRNKILVPGNHDRVWSGHPKPGKPVRPEDIERYQAAGLTIADGIVPYLHYPPNGDGVGKDYTATPQTWTLCHFPDVGDSHDADRFDAWRPKPPSFKGDVIVHGHVHGKWAVNGPRINVGVDVCGFTPVHEDHVAKLVTAAWAR